MTAYAGLMIALAAFIGVIVGASLCAMVLARRYAQARAAQDLAQGVETERQRGVLALLQAERDRLDAQSQQQTQALTQTRDALQTAREEALSASARLAALQAEVTPLREQLREAFETLSQKVLKDRLADLDVAAQKERLQELSAIDALLKPLKEMVERQDRDAVSLKTQLETFLGVNRQLAEALSNSKGRGDWGELELARLLEASGVTFEEQVSVGALRPDIRIPLTNGRCLLIDAKTLLTALERMERETCEAGDAAAQEDARQRHARALESEIGKLSAKAYEAQVRQSVDFVILFVPRESMLRVALEARPDLMEAAFRRNVILASPLILMAILKSVAYEWRQVRLSQDAEKICQVGEELHKRAGAFLQRFDKLGAGINTLAQGYQEAQRALTGRQGMLPQLRKFESLGCASKNPLPELLIDVEAADAPAPASESQLPLVAPLAP